MTLTTIKAKKATLRGDVRRGTALCVVGPYLFGVADCRDRSRTVVVGLAPKDMMEGDEIVGLFTVGTMLSVLSNATPGEPYYLNPVGLPVSAHQLPVGAYLVRLGVALDPTDLWLSFAHLGKKTSESAVVTANPFTAD